MKNKQPEQTDSLKYSKICPEKPSFCNDMSENAVCSGIINYIYQGWSASAQFKIYCLKIYFFVVCSRLLNDFPIAFTIKNIVESSCSVFEYKENLKSLF